MSDLNCYYYDNMDLDTINCTILLSTHVHVPEESDVTLTFRKIKLNVSCVDKECHFQIKTAEHGLPFGSFHIIIMLAKDLRWIDERFSFRKRC